MVDPQLFILFLLASLVLLLTPGPAVLYIMSKSIEQGKKAGLVSVLGIGVGNLVHVTAAAFGFSLIIMKSIVLFTAIKIIGAGYLIYLGIKAIRQKSGFNFEQVEKTELNVKKTFIDGIIVNVFNPKTALFFLAFIPQFINVAYGNILFQTIFYGASFTLLALLSDAIYVLLSEKIRTLLRRNVKFQIYQRYVIGSVYVLLGLLTLLTDTKIEAKKQ